MVTTRSQDRKIASSSSPLPAVEAGTVLSTNAEISPTRTSKTPSARTPASGKRLAQSSTTKIEIVIDVAPKRNATPTPPIQEGSPSEGKEMGQVISQIQPGIFRPAHEPGLPGAFEHNLPSGEADTTRVDGRGALEFMPEDSREVQATLADRLKRPVSPNYAPSSVPKRKRFSSEDVGDTVPGTENPTDQFAGVATSNAADQDSVRDSDDDDDDDGAPPEVISSSFAAQQVLGTLNLSLQHTNRKRREIVRNLNEEDGSPVPAPDLAIAPKPLKPDTAQAEAEESISSSQIPQQNGAGRETGQAPNPVTDDPSTVKPPLQETIEIATAPRTNEVPTPAKSTTQSARNETRLRTPENFDTGAQLQPSEPLVDEDTSTSSETARRMDSEEQHQHAVNLSTSLSPAMSMADRSPSVTDSDVPYPPPQEAVETEVTAESTAMILTPEGQAQGTPELQANTAGTFSFGKKAKAEGSYFSDPLASSTISSRATSLVKT
ncbi:uncharacterized protein PV07_02092 [Cladophialophora immunda]|uniref:Uncharacterized protein n=1 Tax=Cladophialophora immunda TaxID=569365 RepID=A0A0D2DI28_9EURO|nr:uncharacterized protein PV07_02092 [Cladophialophora immunda]KIW35394.1 hypothetical protein PV07_02092 [Cladophialophora immunda]